MAENKRVIMTGIPGVGKTTLLARVEEILKSRKKETRLTSYGTLMLEMAKENGLGSRDDLRRLSIPEQQRLQKVAAEKIASYGEEIVIIDTHAFISSSAGYYPGLPEHVLRAILPTNFISVSAKPEEIYNRRMKDKTRNRDKITLANIKQELDVQSGMISACAVITGAPVRFVLNGEGGADEAAQEIVSAMGL